MVRWLVAFLALIAISKASVTPLVPSSKCKVPLAELKGIKEVVDNFEANGKNKVDAEQATIQVKKFVVKPNQCPELLSNIRDNSLKLIQLYLSVLNNEGTQEELAKMKATYSQLRQECNEKIDALDNAVRQKKRMIEGQVRKNRGDLVTITALQIMAGDLDEAVDTFSELNADTVSSVIFQAYSPGYIENIVAFLGMLDEQTVGSNALLDVILKNSHQDNKHVYILLYKVTLWNKLQTAHVDLDKFKHDLDAGVMNKMEELAYLVYYGYVQEIRQYNTGDYFGFFDVFLENFVHAAYNFKYSTRTSETLFKLSEFFTPKLKGRLFLAMHNTLGDVLKRKRDKFDPAYFQTAVLLKELGDDKLFDKINDKKIATIVKANSFTISKNSSYLSLTNDRYERGGVNYRQVGYSADRQNQAQWHFEADKVTLILKNKDNSEYLDMFAYEDKLVTIPKESERMHTNGFQILINVKSENEIICLLYGPSYGYVVPGEKAPNAKIGYNLNIYDSNNYWVLKAN